MIERDKTRISRALLPSFQETCETNETSEINETNETSRSSEHNKTNESSKISKHFVKLVKNSEPAQTFEPSGSHKSCAWW